ncbi:hypothetical protein BDK51DRAFT_34619 [Blyttiomyces helicus]|uniref:Uncharacterized protein n=1 Tax=Blyttiomyces helicus TaxID=388810 RepID=A0A4P9W0C6_9FUNG|nr:hypothetical protein BDK51DRAFT_34619 [Blyttiomyces helicus]|eukprot:RKO84128.1 hypothetical protein BDK51DRAFT_34619 [Blyttiomyces helicus]
MFSPSISVFSLILFWCCCASSPCRQNSLLLSLSFSNSLSLTLLIVHGGYPERRHASLAPRKTTLCLLDINPAADPLALSQLENQSATSVLVPYPQGWSNPIPKDKGRPANANGCFLLLWLRQPLRIISIGSFLLHLNDSDPEPDPAKEWADGGDCWLKVVYTVRIAQFILVGDLWELDTSASPLRVSSSW